MAGRRRPADGGFGKGDNTFQGFNQGNNFNINFDGNDPNYSGRQGQRPMQNEFTQNIGYNEFDANYAAAPSGGNPMMYNTQQQQLNMYSPPPPRPVKNFWSPGREGNRRDIVLPNESEDYVETESDELAESTNPYWQRRRLTRNESFPEIGELQSQLNRLENVQNKPKADDPENMRPRKNGKQKKLRKKKPGQHGAGRTDRSRSGQLNRNGHDPPPPKVAGLKHNHGNSPPKVKHKRRPKPGADGKDNGNRAKGRKRRERNVNRNHKANGSKHTGSSESMDRFHKTFPNGLGDNNYNNYGL